MEEPRIGVALGSGAARGWAHIGVLRALERNGIVPEVVVGTSAGAFVGAAYASGRLEELDEWARGLGTRDIVSLMDITLSSGGVLAGSRVMSFLEERGLDVPIETLPLRFAAVATDLSTGREVWLQQGSLLEAVRASMALPGVLTPVKRGRGWLVDGGLVDPVPVSLCRAAGADIVIAVELTAGRIGSVVADVESVALEPVEDGLLAPTSDGSDRQDLWRSLSAALQQRLGVMKLSTRRSEPRAPSFYEVVLASIHIMQERISRSRMAGDPPEVLLTPSLGDVRMLDFDLASEAIEAGERCVEAELPKLRAVIDRLS